MSINIEIAYSFKYGAYKAFRSHTESLKGLVEFNEPLIRTMLELPKFVSLRYKPLPKRCYGRYNTFTQIIDISPLQKPYEVLQTMFHELIHVEQYHTGKLKRGLSEKHRAYMYYWKGKPIEYPDPIKEYDKYLNLPWEKEAFEREKPLTNKFIEKAETP